MKYCQVSNRREERLENAVPLAVHSYDGLSQSGVTTIHFGVTSMEVKVAVPDFSQAVCDHLQC